MSLISANRLNRFWQKGIKPIIVRVKVLEDKIESGDIGGGSDVTTEDPVFTGSISMGRKADTTIGKNSTAFGSSVTASGLYSHAEGGSTKASGNYSHAEGFVSKAIGENSHAEGSNSNAEGMHSHAEGFMTIASGLCSHAEGSEAKASGENSHAEGNGTEASGKESFASGYQSEASGYYSFAHGYKSRALASGAVAIGAESYVDRDYAIGLGFHVTSGNFSALTCGKYNKPVSGNASSGDSTGDVFVIGNGYGTTIGDNVSSTYSNAFRVTYTGEVFGTKAYNSSGADYAEFIKPWADGNPDEEDRVGYFVTIKDGLLEKANDGDYIVGITSGNPSVVGNSDEDYYWKYERDIFNRIVMEDVPETKQKTDANGNLMFDKETNMPIMVESGYVNKNARMKVSDDYNPKLQQYYIPRAERAEWDYVGMVGVLPLRDDGSCIPGQFCKCKGDGIATVAEQREFDTYLVIERITDNVVSVLLK